MKRRAVSKVLSGQEICLFCSFRPRVDQSLRCITSASQTLRPFNTSALQNQQAAAKQSDREDEGNFSMLKKNAELSSEFPSRAKPKPPPLPHSAPAPSIQSTSRTPHESTNGFQHQRPPGNSQDSLASGQQPFSKRYGSRNEGWQNSRDGQEQSSFRAKRFPFDNNGQPGRIYGQDRGQGGSVNSGSGDASNASRRADQRQGGFTIRKIGMGSDREPNDSEGRDTFNSPRPRQSYGFQPRSSNRDTVGGYAERNRQDEISNDRVGFRTRQPFNTDSGRFSQDNAYTKDNMQFGRTREPEGQSFKSQTANDNQAFTARSARGARHGDYNTRRQDNYTSNFTERSGPDRTRTNVKNDYTPAGAAPAVGDDSVDIDGIEVPAGSTFDSAFGDRDGRRALRDKRNRRSDRFEELDEEGIGSVPNLTQIKKKGPPSTFDFELAEAEEMLYGDGGRKKKKKKQKAQTKSEASQPSRPSIQLPEFVSVERLARVLKVNIDQFVRTLEKEGFEGARYDHVLDSSTSSMLADLYGFEAIVAGSGPVEDLVPRPPPEDASMLPPRPPIVTIMGHVDHGKTTILDYLRKSSVVATEHGGITQHIGAFSVTMPDTNRQITFLDTPGHAAFLEMRRRGANVTDIVVLVVAADDSVKPQTVEAIKHALQANVQLIVAINKVDKADADIERVKQDLTRHDIVVEDYGGDYQVIPVSGKTGQGMDALEEAIITLADVSDFRAETDGPAEGWVLESKVTAGGRVATVLVRRGTLRTGDFIVAGTTWARVRTLRNDAGALVSEAPPGTPVQVDGWRAGDPDAGLEVIQADDEDHAKDVVDLRLGQQETAKAAVNLAALNTTRTEDADARTKVLAWEAEQAWSKKGFGARPVDNEGWVDTEKVTGLKQVPFVIKADVAGSVEAVAAAVVAIGNNEIAANVIHSAVGELTEFDIRRLTVTGEVAYAINFNQSVDGSIARLAEAANIRILNHNIIYKVTDDVKEKLAAELPPVVTQRVVGEAEVGQLFEITVKKNKIKIAGCRVTNGTIARANKIRVLRNGENVYTGTLHSLKNVKKDVTEMRKGTECGMGFHEWEDFREGDQIQSFEEHEEKRTLY